jgi:N-acyl-phosphatidylethanolamine-hydrolysing phospholipase D
MKRANDLVPMSHHLPAGGFRNPWAGGSLHGTRGLLKWMLTRSRTPSPARKSLAEMSYGEAPPAASEQPRITWVGHSSFLIQVAGLNVLTDPVWSDRASPVSFAGPRRLVPPGLPLSDLPRIDITLLSHDHYDHLDRATVETLIARFPEMVWMTPLGVAQFVKSRGAKSVEELDWWDEVTVGNATIGCTPAQHFSGRLPWNRNSTLWCGWTLRIEDFSVFFAGDTGLHPEFARIAERFGPFDVAILPIGAYEPRWFMQPVHMSPEEAVQAYMDIVSAAPSHGCIMLGSHWGTFRLTDEPVDEPPALTRVSWERANLPSENLWIFMHGENRTMK